MAAAALLSGDELACACALYAAVHGSNSAPAPEPAPLREEDPAMFHAITGLLERESIEHTVLRHAPTRTSQESADVRGVPLASGAKAMLVTLPAKAALRGAFPAATHALLVLSAALKVDWKALRAALGRKAKLASEEEVWTLTHCLPGAVPPFGSLFSASGPLAAPAPPAERAVVTLLDPSLAPQGRINFNAGLKTASVGMAAAAYEAVEVPQALAFAV